MRDISLGADATAVRLRPAGSRLRALAGLDLDHGARRGRMMAGRLVPGRFRCVRACGGEPEPTWLGDRQLRQSSDGPVYLHVLGPIVHLLRKADAPYTALSPREQDNASKYRRIQSIVQERYGKSMDTPRHFEKVQWFASYWNKEITASFGLRIRGVALDPTPATWG
jgi:hypothetical protein